MPLSHQPKDVESYELKDDEVKTWKQVNFLELNTLSVLLQFEMTPMKIFLIMAITKKKIRSSTAPEK